MPLRCFVDYDDDDADDDARKMLRKMLQQTPQNLRILLRKM